MTQGSIHQDTVILLSNTDVHSSITHDNQKVETTQMSTDIYMEKQNSGMSTLWAVIHSI